MWELTFTVRMHEADMRRAYKLMEMLKLVALFESNFFRFRLQELKVSKVFSPYTSMLGDI